ncbi:hypothetical protein N7462_010178 [Penicillium macrosclerotiorum]|uniref:uncharacterized protein n=1 Tax=Penicillium macrosclerotiorum TaxID=303699 RepID=UPI00254675DE|nr:uncharacterized protein N7462_010178 [Penicillium macrosclerotiorum]KAJ5669108.1 hypothetical protein N7462_010178 [Penicillium macrosclerotiorum]
MSDFFRRASDALQHRTRQDSTSSTSSTEGAIDSSAAKAPDQPLNQQAQTAQPQPQTHAYPNESFSSTAPGIVCTCVNEIILENIANPKPRRLWGWKHDQENKTDPKQIPAQKKDDTDWIFGT